MFICSVRASTLRFLGVVLLSAVALLSVSLYAGAATPTSAVSVEYTDIRTEEDRREFISSFGYKTAGDAVAKEEFVLPRKLDTVLLGYNEIQKQQGLDLEKYAGKTVTRYTYALTDYGEYEGTVYANLILYRHKVIAADITAPEAGGFVRPLG